MQMYFSLPLQTFNVPLQTDKCTPSFTSTQVLTLLLSINECSL